MQQHIYITGAERGSGKSAVALAMMEHLYARGGAIGFADAKRYDATHRLHRNAAWHSR